MYNGRRPELTYEFMIGVTEFLNAAKWHAHQLNENLIRCPCVKCKNIKFLEPEIVKKHIYRRGFIDDYWYWTSHGEYDPRSHSTSNIVHNINEHENVTYTDMVFDAAGPVFRAHYEECSERNEEPNDTDRRFLHLLSLANQPLWEGCTETELSVAVQLLTIKSESNISQKHFKEYATLMRRITPNPDSVPLDYYRTKKKVSALGLQYQTIDCCIDGCMLFYGQDKDEKVCKWCQHPRYKPQEDRSTSKLTPWKKLWYFSIIPRLKRLYASMRSAEHMTWHHRYIRTEGVIQHPSDADAWKHFNRTQCSTWPVCRWF